MARLIDRTPATEKSWQMKLLCLGAPRSGTHSLAQVLESLGYHTFNGMAHNFRVDNRFRLWTEALRAKHKGQPAPYTASDFDKFLGPYDAIAGWPAALFADELVVAYPDAKVILVPRDADAWVESWNRTVVAAHKRWDSWRWILPICGGLHQEFREMADEAMHCWTNPGGDPFDPVDQKAFYLQYVQHIRDTVPKARLLEWLPQDGLEPLCKFLGRDPDEAIAIPRTNTTETMNKSMRFVLFTAIIKAALKVMAGTGLAVAALRFTGAWSRVRRLTIS